MEWSANYVLAEAQISGIDSLHLCITIPPLIDKIIIRNRWHMKKVAYEEGMYKMYWFKKLQHSFMKLGAVGTPRSLRLHLHLPQRSSHRQIQMESGSYDRQRGALIVLEGLDRCGKTSQSSRLVSHSREKRIFCRIMEVSGQNRQCWGDDICLSFQQITTGRSNNSTAFQCQSLGEEAPEIGLLTPDPVVYLDIPPEKAAERGEIMDMSDMSSLSFK
ncbi:thymidylate kinase isoform X1 [Cinnamomum micranthum f. kanehirae]|uniref:Thymidylate kinase isoform X1 n=1 Tax=Cinnamomum micranthum f. kanehirae TaxID=337451 RepID=A0A3S3M8R9_9MAGN|nr:thymidylate kinase isoform X1 [Cinnamomum micranthum f. kanehirae]